jgi:hypothetical protein
MAMPASGNIAIINNTLQTCSSLCASVLGSTGSLLDASVIAGKTAPHAMSEFYSFCRENSYKCVGLNQISAAGSNGTASVCSTDCICSTSAMVADQCYTITICHCLCTNTCTGSAAYARGCCNSASLYSCTKSNTSSGWSTFSCTFNVIQGDTICVMICAIHPIPGGTCCSCVYECIHTVVATRGLFCRAASPIACTIYTC